MDRTKYPIGADFYELYEVVGQGVSASVYRARCIPLNETVAIKIIDFERDNCDLNNISREAQTMILVDHPNVLKAHCSFVSDHNLWVVTPFMAGGSCLHILKAAYPDGFGETVIATILREALKGLAYLHFHGHIHRDVKAGNILVGSRGAIKLGDFGVSACLFDSGDRQRTRNTFVGTPCWMAPEVMEQLHGYDFKADIWSFGITALELAHGHAPFSKYPPMKVLLMTLQNAPPGLDYERDKKFSKSFKQMIAMCLVKDPMKRPSARKLLKHSFFKQARSNDYIARTILEGLPALGDRLKELKRKEEDMLAQKKMPDGQKEEISQNEYKRGISGWNFNIEDMKAQASLIQDVEDMMSDKDQGGSSDSLFGFDLQGKQSQCHPTTMSDYWKDDTADNEDDDARQNRPSPLPSADLNMNNIKGRFDGSKDDLSVKGTNYVHSFSQHDFPLRDDHIGNDLSENSELQISGRNLEGIDVHSRSKRGGSSGTHLPDLSLLTLNGESDTQQSQAPNVVSYSGVVVPQVVGDTTSETLSRASKSSASNSEDLDEKGKVSIVQQKGRFKVTSVNVDLEKALPPPMLQKSHSLQAIPQLSANPLQSPPDPTSSNHPSAPLNIQLHCTLQTIFLLRDCVVSFTKQHCLGDFPGACGCATDGRHVPAAIIEKSLLDESHEKEKELVQEITELNWRLLSIHDEFQRLTVKYSQCPVLVKEPTKSHEEDKNK